MNGDLNLRNRQRHWRIDLKSFSQILRFVAEDALALESYDLSIRFVGSREMERLNKLHMNHTGSTDVITLDYVEKSSHATITGELFICPDVAAEQASRFKTSMQEELARYAIHGILHLCGHDDIESRERRKMKREEARLLARISQRFDLSKIARKPRLPA